MICLGIEELISRNISLHRLTQLAITEFQLKLKIKIKIRASYVPWLSKWRGWAMNRWGNRGGRCPLAYDRPMMMAIRKGVKPLHGQEGYEPQLLSYVLEVSTPSLRKLLPHVSHGASPSGEMVTGAVGTARIMCIVIVFHLYIISQALSVTILMLSPMYLIWRLVSSPESGVLYKLLVRYIHSTFVCLIYKRHVGSRKKDRIWC